MSDILAEEAKDKIQNEYLLNKKNLILLSSSLIIGILYDVLLARSTLGIAYPIFIIAVCLIIYKNNADILVKKWSFGWFIGLAAFLLSITYFLFTNQLFRSLNAFIIPVFLVAHILLITKSNCYPWANWKFGKELFKAVVVRPFNNLFKPCSLLWCLILDYGNQEENKFSLFKRVALGLIIALPILGVVGALLSSADLVFEKFWVDLVKNINIWNLIYHLFIIIVITFMSFSFLFGLDKPLIKIKEESCLIRHIDAVIVITILFLLALLYAIFCFIQFAYLFGAGAQLLPEGFSYAEYARRGFFELVQVALINICIVAANIHFTKPAGNLTNKIIKVLNSLLLFSTFVMLISAFQRMSLYEANFGYTYLRVLTHSFMVMIFFILLVTLYRVWRNRISLAKWYIVIGIVYYLVINFVNIDVIIAKKNMERYYATGEIDVGLFWNMSDDTIPYLVEIAASANGEVAAKAHEMLRVKAKYDLIITKNTEWQAYNLSRQKAKRVLIDNGIISF